MADPYLSIVATSRNDDHGGNLLGRMQLFVDTLREQGATHGLAAELILVEWNPPPERPRLVDALTWPRFPGAPPVRFIEVPPEIHRRFDHADRLPLFQMIAKNVGIRRARGAFILATNIDILLSDELVRLIAKGRLSERRMYRVDRYDVAPGVPSGLSNRAVLEHCRRNVIRVNRREGIYRADGQLYRPPVPPKPPPKPTSLRPKHVLHRIVKGDWRPTKVAEPYIHRLAGYVHRLRQPRPTSLHTIACGDFTLMARDRWWALRAYPELQIFSLHLDSLLCYMAHHGGAREKVLGDPMRAYHLEHQHGSGWTPEGQEALTERIAGAGIPILDKGELRRMAVQARLQGHPIIFNDESWGLAKEQLLEVTIP
jgi:hypothetical protein